MAGKPPKISVKTKHKTSGEQKSIIAIWDNDGRMSFTLDKSIAEIRFVDGSALRPSDFGREGTVYGNVYEAGSAPPNAQRRSNNDDDNMPF